MVGKKVSKGIVILFLLLASIVQADPWSKDVPMIGEKDQLIIDRFILKSCMQEALAVQFIASQRDKSVKKEDLKKLLHSNPKANKNNFKRVDKIVDIVYESNLSPTTLFNMYLTGCMKFHLHGHYT